MTQTQQVDFGAWLQKELDRRNMSLDDLAYVTKYSRETVRSWLYNRRGLSDHSAIVLASVLNVPVSVVRKAAGMAEKAGPLPAASFAHTPSVSEPGVVVVVPVIGSVPSEVGSEVSGQGAIMVPADRLQGITTPKAVLVRGNDLTQRGVKDGDYLVAESAQPLEPENGKVVVVEMDGYLRAWEWWSNDDEVILRPAGPGDPVRICLDNGRPNFELRGIARLNISMTEL